MSTDEAYAAALAEVDSEKRQPGLWARCFAQADGDESKARAAYVNEVVATVDKPIKPMVTVCPSCGRPCPPDATRCRPCGVVFGHGWQPVLSDQPTVAKAPTASAAAVDGGPSALAVVLWILGGGFALFVGWAVVQGGSPEAKAQQREREAIKYCWTEQERKSLDPGSQRFVARACEMMEREYENKYRSKP